MTTRLFGFILLIGSITGCAGGTRSVVLLHSGGFSGIEQQYSIDREGRIMERSKLSQDTLRTTRIGIADRSASDRVFEFIERHHVELDSLQLHGSGNLTTAIAIIDRKRLTKLQWPALDPPHLQTSVVDSLYQMMVAVQEQIGKLPAINP
jgi:hypothetical protein